MNTLYPKVTVATIVYGNRWQFLSQVVEAVMNDPHVVKMIIVDNGSENKDEIKNGVTLYGDKIFVLRLEKNTGSAGGFAKALEKSRGTDCDFVLLLDDDSVPEDGFVSSFMNVLQLFPSKKVIISGSRADVLENKEYFYKPSLASDLPRMTFFEVFSFKKIINFLNFFELQKKKTKRGPFIPIIPTEGFVYGGTFLPIEAVRKAELPDESLFLYGDDIEYSWNIKNMGYESYLSCKPIIHDIDLTFGTNSSHIFGQFDKQVSSLRVYYRIRNMVRLSRKHSKQSKVVLFFNIFFWMLGLYILGLYKNGLSSLYFKRVKLMTIAVIAGYNLHSKIGEETEKSFFG